MVSSIPFIAIGWLLGTAAQLLQPQLWSLTVYLALGVSAFCFLAVFIFARRAGALWLVAFLVASSALAFALAGARSSWYLDHALNPALEGQTLQVEGVIANMPQRMDESLRFRFAVKSDELPPEILLGWYGSKTEAVPTDLHAGESWRLSVRLKAPHGHINPYGFDFEMWLWEQGLQATGYVRHGLKLQASKELSSNWAYPVEQWRQSVRSAIDARVSDRAVAGIISALLVGEQSAIERADWDVFRATGVAHLMSISGLHITGLAWLAALCASWLWRRSDIWSPKKPWSLWLAAPLAADVCAVFVALIYAAFTGWGVPAQRTVLMLAVVTLLRLSGKRWPWPHVWLCVCAVVLALDPWAMLQAGFWLSFVAVAILFASGKTPSEKSDANSIVKLFREQWLMSVCLAPLTLLLFHQISLVGWFANLWAVPWVTLVVTPLCMLGLVFPLGWEWAEAALRLLLWGLKAFASVPWAQWSAPAAPWWAGLAALLGMGLSAMRLPIWMRLFGIVLVMPVLSWQTPRPAMGTFELLATDMGQGHAVLLRTAHHSLLYDTGPRYSVETDAGQRVLVPLLRAMGERLDRIVISHQDSDHSGGAPAVIAMQPQADVLTSIAAQHPLRQRHFMQRCQRGQTWEWDGVVFTVLHPSASDYDNTAKPLKPNALSCVLRVSSPNSTALLVGDIEAPQEKGLLQSEQSLRADWLLVPHHGSATSSTAVFLQAVAPKVAVVQAGYRNRFGHPRAEVMARYEELGVHVVQSPRCGASLWHSEQPNVVHCERDEQQHYWQHRFP